jgi:hypothetical protein
MFGWLSSKEVVQFGKMMALEFSNKFPPEMESAVGEKPLKLYRVALNGIKSKASTFHKEKNLGLYRKAKLGNTLKWELRERGFSEELADKVTQSIIISIASNQR